MNCINLFIKTAILFIWYLFSNMLIGDILAIFKINDRLMINFVSDILFMFIALILYRKDIIFSIKRFNNEYKLSTKIFIIMKYVSLIFVVISIYGIIVSIIFKCESVTDANMNSFYIYAKTSPLYAVLKSLIFAVIAEELLFKKSIRDLITNNILFIIISGSIYAFMNIAYTDLSFISAITFIRCFIFSSILSYIYIKNDDNIFMVMLVKFFYNLIPLLLLLLGV